LPAGRWLNVWRVAQGKLRHDPGHPPPPPEGSPGRKVLTLRDSQGFIDGPDEMTREKIDGSRRTRPSGAAHLRYAEEFPQGELPRGDTAFDGAGGVAVSGLEMRRNSERRAWKVAFSSSNCSTSWRAFASAASRTAAKPTAMSICQRREHAGFKKVADAMPAFGMA